MKTAQCDNGRGYKVNQEGYKQDITFELKVDEQEFIRVFQQREYLATKIYKGEKKAT